MKKFLGIIIGVFFLVVIAGCQAKTSATVTFADEEITQTEITFSVEINDPDEEITGLITVNLLKPDGTIAKTDQIDDQDEEIVDFSFYSLENEVTYTVEVKATVGRDAIVIGTVEYTTLTASIIHITTPEQFLNMNTNRSGNYVLDNDLDFTDVAFASPFTSSFSGVFDGQGYTISNVTFSSITTYTGIFGYVSSGTIKNLNIENVTIGTAAEPLLILTSSRVGILAGYVSSSTASIENISITDSEINYSSASIVQAYVGAVAGEFRANLVGLTVDNVSITVTSTSYGRIKIGGAIGLLQEDGRLKEATVNADIHFIMAGSNLKNRDIQVNIGGVIGDHNARNNYKSVENIASLSDIVVDLDFGTTNDTTFGNYAVYVGGIAGIAMSNVVNGFYGGSITLNHEKNDNEEDVVKSFFVGGLFGFYASNKALLQIVRFGNGQTMDINISDDVTLKASQTLGDKASTAVHVIGIYGDTSLNVNLVSMVGSDTSTIYTELTDYFTSDWILDAFDAVDLPG